MSELILVVEDDVEIRELLAEMLADAGYRVEVAANGAEGLKRLAQERPCVVILDLMMPVMDGWQLRQRMLADPALSDIPVIIVSGAADLPDTTAPLAARHVFAKPVRWPTLLAAVQAHC